MSISETLKNSMFNIKLRRCFLECHLRHYGYATVSLGILITVKLQGRPAWDYLGKFFTGFFNGCRDFLSLAPQNIDLAVCQ